MKNNLFYYKVAIKAPLFKVLTYSFPELLKAGQKVRAPLGKKKTVSGLIVGADPEGAERGRIKPIERIMDPPPLG